MTKMAVREYTYQQLLERMERAGVSLAEVALGRMMDIIEEQTGTFPDIAPDWCVNNCMGEKQDDR